MKAVITIVGQDQVGIVAMVSGVLAANGVNVLNINQNILDGFLFVVFWILQLSFSFALMQKKQKIKAARILLKSGSVELKGVKLATLKQHPLLNAPHTLIS